MIKLYETARNAAGASNLCSGGFLRRSFRGKPCCKQKGRASLLAAKRTPLCEATRPTKYELSQSRVSATRRSRAQQLGLSGVAHTKAGRFKQDSV